MIPSFDVPTQYFYALAAGLPTSIPPGVRYRLATLSDEKAIVDTLRKAVEDGTIVEDAVVTVEMAARRLHALGSVSGVTPVCASGVGLALTQAYAAYETTPPEDEPGDDIAPFWDNLLADAGRARAHLELILAAIFDLPDPRPLINDVNTTAGIPDLLSVRNLDADPWPGNPAELTYGNWVTFFTAHPEHMPPVIGPGTLDEQVGRFVARLRSYFAVTSTVQGPNTGALPGPPTFPPAVFDPITGIVTAYRATPGNAAWAWGDGLDPSDRDAAIDTLGMDEDGQACGLPRRSRRSTR